MMNSFFRQTSTIHLFVWLLLMLTGIAVFSIYYPWQIVTLHATSNTLLCAILFYGSSWVVNRFVETSRVMLGIFVELALFMGISLIRIIINFKLTQVFPGEQYRNGLFTPLGRVAALVITTSLFVSVLGLSYQLLRNRYQREKQAKTLLQEQQAAQLHLLKAQINPHFLFNALNNIYSLVELRSAEAPKMLLKLSDLLRYVIYEGQKTVIPLAKEVEYIRVFIELFQMRSEYPAKIRFEVSGGLSHINIEPMILIPLVENCFKHADFDLNPDAWATFTLENTEEYLRFYTQNTFMPGNLQKDAVGGVGLQNITRRLQLRYPDRYEFNNTVENNIFTVKMTINHPIA